MAITESNGVVTLTSSSHDAVAQVALLGATIISFKTQNIERLFTSSLSSVTGRKAIRGGAPIW